ncbi:MAG: bifunctional (p)ppGpp synthetase/guanosine-3',5'-bis(diphosphate) 3'-pyrophosphohydrolase [Clostridiales bacterium]|nr:bifunctional (p)ppGpp synthetase/guanosine-3',5'-bis(diphosphate) 3'-pyrophosphohydrolase [Clostridiales bacterium]
MRMPEKETKRKKCGAMTEERKGDVPIYHAVTDCNKESIVKDDRATPEELYAELVKKIRQYHPSDDLSRVEKAYLVAKEYHKDQKRKSGEPYIIHPLRVAIILAELEMDKESIIAGILHDVVEDTSMTIEELEAEFGSDVALLVDGVTKLTRLSWDGDKTELQAENLRKMFLAMAKDIRVIIIKLADRLHNMRTLQFMKPEKQKEKSRETLDIFAPIASRLGISKIKIELDNLALSYLHPEEYKKLVQAIDQKKSAREDYIQQIVDEVRGHLTAAGIKVEVYGRVKHYFSIYKKMKVQEKTLDQIYDLFAVRVLVDTVQDCYAVLGLIHEMYTPMPGRFKDYIAMPKPNRYQSLHTTLIAKNGTPFEIQIRTYEMHKTAEYGIAAHWKYKEGNTSNTALSGEEEKLSWLRQILEWQREMSDNGEFLSSLKSDLNIFSEKVYCFTPNGDVKNLPKGSTPVDFAYSIHSAVGNRMVGARANDKLVPIDYQIQNGDRIEVITSQNSKGPSRDWLSIVKSTQAKNKINQWFKEQNKEDNIFKGRELLEHYCKSRGIALSDITKPEYIEKVLAKYGFREWNAVLAAIGHGGLKEGQVANKLLEEKKKDDRNRITDQEVLQAVAENSTKKPALRKTKNGIVVEGLDDLAVHFSRCCNPIPGDEIVGFITRGRGVSIHRTDCINVLNLPENERSRLIEAEWHQQIQQTEKYQTEITIYANNRIGLLADISRVLAEGEVDIRSLNTRTSKQDVATVSLHFETSGVDEINRIIQKLRQVEGVMDIQRTAQ